MMKPIRKYLTGMLFNFFVPENSHEYLECLMGAGGTSRILYEILEAVHPSSVYSDHSLIQCTINIQKPANIHKREAVRDKKYKWDPSSKDEFIERLQDKSTLEKMTNLFSDAGDSPSEQSVNDLIESFTNLIQEHADPLFSHTTVIADSPRSDET